MRLTAKFGVGATLLMAACALLLPSHSAAQSAAKAATPPTKTAPKPAASSKATNSKTTPAKKSTKRRSKRARRQTAPTNDRIREIQAALIRSGHLSGEPNGKWDAKCVAAMKEFQGANGLKATGKFDAASLQKLGLGSETAGVAAPRPVASAETGSRQR